jgi:hypothetical protein
MTHHFKQGDRALFVYEEDLLEGTVQDANDEEVIIQFDGISYPSNVEAAQLQHVHPEYAVSF